CQSSIASIFILILMDIIEDMQATGVEKWYKISVLHTTIKLYDNFKTFEPIFVVYVDKAYLIWVDRQDLLLGYHSFESMNQIYLWIYSFTLLHIFPENFSFTFILNKEIVDKNILHKPLRNLKCVLVISLDFSIKFFKAVLILRQVDKGG
ncbi:hypothetical protein ACJX0J_037762, partial [Zea mays]